MKCNSITLAPKDWTKLRDSICEFRKDLTGKTIAEVVKFLAAEKVKCNETLLRNLQADLHIWQAEKSQTPDAMQSLPSFLRFDEKS